MASIFQNDSTVLTRLRDRDPETLAATVQEFARPLYRAARGLRFDANEAEDLVQDVFTVFLQRIDQFEGRSQLRTWLFGILHNKMRERRRALQREQEVHSLDPSFESFFDSRGHWTRVPEDLERVFASKETGKAVDDCLSSLPSQQREVFMLREVEDLNTKDICNNLQITDTHVGVLIHRARHRLRECMEAKGWG